MGVPKFFRYTSERYPCLNELVKQYQIPDFDNMYLDMNGIIHNCSHPDDSNPHFRITEEKIFQDIFHYISILFQIIKPKKLFFMAIDGVAPRAKMNQQRGRRFRSAREAEKLEEEARDKGEVLPTEKRFDSNCITPGTVFMARLHQQLRYFVKEKMSSDPLWAKVKVILSGHETPGEGEHKIMDYIRWARSQPDYDPATRHCLYGLDADLIMLGVCTHEPHFALLREEVKFGKTTQRATSPEETNFYLLHLSLLREYLEQEFIGIKDKLPFEYDIENVVDDWVLMGFLVGNDFIPNLPNMHISNDALPLLYKTYMTVLPTLDGYINEAGDLNLGRFEIFMQELAKIDKEKFQDTYTDLKYFEAKTGRRPNERERKEYKPNNDETFNINIDDIKANKPDDELQALINATQDMYMDDDEIFNDDYEETSDEEANIEMEFILHKKDYYMNKLDYSKVTDEVLADQAEGYVRAIQWNLWYYYKGCPSWCWYYPHHYAPYISDIRGFKDHKIEFELGEPFKPFEQLLAVLPAASKHLLPAPFHDLMTDEESPIVHYYPVHFETDLNGKRNDWEAVVLIPFIDETNLLSAMGPCYQRLTEEEHKRNSHGPMLVYNWTPVSQGPVEAPAHFPVIQNCHAIEKPIWRQELDVPEDKLKKGMLPNARRDMLFPGFPTMRHLKYTTSLRKGKVKVFDQQSRNENMIVQLLNQPSAEPDLEQVATELLGKSIWGGWPHLTCAKVISVSNERMRLHHIEQRDNNAAQYSVEQNQGNLHKQWISERSTIIEHNMNRLGIELGNVKIIVHAVNLKGYKYVIQDNVQMVQEPQWCTIPCGYALQAVVKDVSAYIVREAGKFSTPQEAYPPGDHVFLLTMGPYYGCLATVVDSESVKSGRIKVQVSERPEPTPIAQAATAACPYKTANHAAASCGISSQMLSRITGTVFVVSGEKNDLPTETQNKVNIGLNLKFNKKNQEVSGFTRRCKLTGSWLYSARCVELVKSYARQYPELFDKLAHTLNNDIFFEGELWPGQVGEKKPQEVHAWLKSQPHASAPRRECGSEALEPEEMKALAASLDRQLITLKDQEKKVTLHVKWSLLYKPELHEGNLSPDSKADFKMYDRVVCVARNITVPLGAKGTITAIYQPPDSNTVRLSDKLNAEPSYQVMFDESFPGGVIEDLFEEARFYRMLPTNMLNISYGRKLRGSGGGGGGGGVASPASFGLSAAPAVLRRGQDTQHHSAFANYSPPVDRKFQDVRISPQATTQQTPPPNQPIAANNNEPAQPQSETKSSDNATHLLRSLLKISENDTDSVKRNKNTAQNLDQQNWRAKPENTQPPPHQKLQQQNWRTENAANFNNPRPQQPGYNPEWTNSNFKPQPAPPLPPFPVFAASPSLPFPQFNNPHFQQRAHAQHAPHTPHTPHTPHIQHTPHSQQGYRVLPPPGQPHPPQGHLPQAQGHPPPHGFPKHLPTVSGNVTLGPSWNKDLGHPFQTDMDKDRAAGGAGPGAGRAPPNPFVPLQVQTSQRRVQNTGGQSSRKNQKGLPTPQSIMLHPQTVNAPMTQEENNSSRPQRKRKPRIAANLPFQTE